MEKIMVYVRENVFDYDGHKLSDIVEKFGNDTVISIEYGHYYNEQDLAYFSYERLETDEEFNTRKKSIADQARFKRGETRRKLNLKDVEYKKYLELKKKYEEYKKYLELKKKYEG